VESKNTLEQKEEYMPIVYIVWGTEDVKAAEEGEWKEMENSPSEYKFLTELEAEAFLKGVEECIGWMDYMVLDKHLVEVAEKVRSKKHAN
jgi:hypothetical protein